MARTVEQFSQRQVLKRIKEVLDLLEEPMKWSKTPHIYIEAKGRLHEAFANCAKDQIFTDRLKNNLGKAKREMLEGLYAEWEETAEVAG